MGYHGGGILLKKLMKNDRFTFNPENGIYYIIDYFTGDNEVFYTHERTKKQYHASGDWLVFQSWEDR